MLLSPFITSIIATTATLLITHWAMTLVAGERDLLVFTEWVILSTQLLKSFSAEVALWLEWGEHLHGAQISL